MEKVVSLSERHGDKRQRIRAKWIMREFECAEASVYALGAHIFPSSGTVENAGQALEYINFLPEAVKYDLKRLSLHEDREKNDFDLIWGFSWHFKGFCTPKTISAAAAFCSDPEVRKAFEAAAKNPGIPAQTKGLLDILMKTQNNQPVENLLRDGSFENNNLDGWNWQITSEKAFLGQKSLTSPVRNTSLQLIKGKEFPIKPGSYLLSAMVFVEKDNPDVEEHVRMSVYYGNKGVNQGGAEAPRVCVKPGEWRRLSMIFDIPNKELDYFDFGISFYNYSGGDLAYADDIIITPLNLNQR
jgi:hypothetical protein